MVTRVLSRTGWKREIVRKVFHIACSVAVVSLLQAFGAWYQAILAVLCFVLVVYPVLAMLERFPFYQTLLSERRPGEVKRSMLLMCFMTTILVAVFWGLLGEAWKFVTVAAVSAWGLGDSAAAIVGKRFGRHPIQHPLIEGKKTLEGTLAMYVMACLAIFATTMACSATPWYLCMLVSLLVGPVCAAVELLSRRGIDTFTVPLSAAASTFGLLWLFSFLGI